MFSWVFHHGSRDPTCQAKILRHFSTVYVFRPFWPVGLVTAKVLVQPLEIFKGVFKLIDFFFFYYFANMIFCTFFDSFVNTLSSYFFMLHFVSVELKDPACFIWIDLHLHLHFMYILLSECLIKHFDYTSNQCDYASSVGSHVVAGWPQMGLDCMTAQPKLYLCMVNTRWQHFTTGSEVGADKY